MIEQLSVHDFQNHHRKEVVFASRITILSGASDSGKSALLRALYWLCRNQPAGEEFIGKYGKAIQASVQLLVDKKLIVRSKGSGENLYKINGKVLEAFGKGGIPADVQQLTNLGETNFQHQLDPPFWLTLTPGQLSKELNSIINLGEIDATLARVGQRVRQAKARIQVSTERLHSAKQKRRQLAGAVTFSRLVAAAEAVDHQRRTVTDARFRGLGLIESIVTGVRAKVAKENALATYSSAIKVGQELADTAKKADSLRSVLANVDRFSQQVAVSTPKLTELERLAKELEQLRQRRMALSSLLLGLAQLEHQHTLADGLLNDAIKDLKKASNGKCPVCQSTWSPFSAATSI